MRKIVIFLYLLAAAGVAGGAAGPRDDAAGLASWGQELRQALVSGKGRGLERFFTTEAFEREMPGWKYNLEDGFLDFARTEVVPLSDRAILLHIPTDNRPYSADNDAYFDFVFRIFEVQRAGDGFRISRRSEEAFNPDFIHVRSRIEIRPGERRLLIDSEATADLRSNNLFFMLAKEFEIEEFQINGRKAPYARLGYIVRVPCDGGKRVVFRVKGKLPAVGDNSQFFSMDENCFFLRYSGLAAIPSPPPGANGRYYFSRDQTSFETTYIFPKEFPFLHYGRVRDEKIIGDQRVLTTSYEGEWMDELSFYGQRNWVPTTISSGNARLVFYFPGKDRALGESMAGEIRKLLDWSYSVFQAYPESHINFVVLDRFLRNGALNDSHSIITQDAQTQADDTYIHEILHNVPQPKIEGGFLWQKEGFTQFLSFDFIDFRSGRPEYWKGEQRWFLHALDQFAEPLSALTNVRDMPTYRAAYDKGPWVYRMLSAVIGEANFRKAMLEFAKMKGRTLAGPRDYFGIFEKISGQDLAWFEDQWLNRKENPVLRIERSSQASSGGEQVKLKVTQEGTVFRLPLEVEIQGPNDKIRKTLWLDSTVQEFSIPIKGPATSVLYDPDAKLFAILKTGKASFLGPNDVRLPAKETIYRFKSSLSGKEIEYRILPGGKNVVFVKKDGGEESVLELSPALSPSKYAVNGALVYSLDAAAGKIAFSDGAYDIAEPVYPEDFIIGLFSCLDWKKNSASSLLYLRSGLKRCAVARAVRERVPGPDIKLKVDVRDGMLEIQMRNGVLVEYTVDDKEKFVLVDR